MGRFSVSRSGGGVSRWITGIGGIAGIAGIAGILWTSAKGRSDVIDAIRLQMDFDRRPKKAAPKVGRPVRCVVVFFSIFISHAFPCSCVFAIFVRVRSRSGRMQMRHRRVALTQRGIYANDRTRWSLIGPDRMALQCMQMRPREMRNVRKCGVAFVCTPSLIGVTD